eukprot:1042947-Amphidinium_carterae.1
MTRTNCDPAISDTHVTVSSKAADRTTSIADQAQSNFNISLTDFCSLFGIFLPRKISVLRSKVTISAGTWDLGSDFRCFHIGSPLLVPCRPRWQHISKSRLQSAMGSYVSIDGAGSGCRPEAFDSLDKL